MVNCTENVAIAEGELDGAEVHTATVRYSGSEWILDLGCTFYKCLYRDWFTTNQVIDGGKVLKNGKLEPRARKCIFLEYAEEVKCYRLWCSDNKSSKLLISKDDAFEECFVK